MTGPIAVGGARSEPRGHSCRTMCTRGHAETTDRPPSSRWLRAPGRNSRNKRETWEDFDKHSPFPEFFFSLSCCGIVENGYVCTVAIPRTPANQIGAAISTRENEKRRPTL
ncbi:hypothetical protein FQN60_010644 [Etheostoma spectabile]|uniref:Uncharacterized protein n=1 Tax=Etheostoma spectabile TaxID=54343 RepID=A0A5J5CD51_9PERO|nr:hypothetical protein FQN60_010644 [Etheostoma spectabile]